MYIVSIKAIINLTSFISGTLDVIFLNFFSLEHHHLPDVFFGGAPSQDRARDRLTYPPEKLVLEVLLTAFLRKRMATLNTTEKRLQVLKGKLGRYMFLFTVVLTARLSFFVSDLVREVKVC